MTGQRNVEWVEVRRIVRQVFDLPVPEKTPCPQDWREYRLQEEIKRLFDEAGA